VYPKAHFEEVAKRATKAAPEVLRQKVGYPPPFVGDICCAVKSYENDLDGINAKSHVNFEWRFRCSFKGVVIEGTRVVRHHARSIYYGQVLPFPPRGIRAAACAVWALVVFAAALRLLLL
jgi:hypothetical protein